MRLIDADELMDDISRMYVPCDAHHTYDGIKYRIDHAPTIESEPVRHGRWIKDKDGFHHCSECGENTDRQEDSYGYDVNEFMTMYCGSCGAKMDGKAVKQNDKP